MATIPQNTGYQVVYGAGTGPNGYRIDVWLEYDVESQSITNNTSYIKVEFYACLKEGYSSDTRGSSGRSSTLTVNGVSTTTSGAYDFQYDDQPNHYGSYAGNIAHNSDGTKTISILGTFTTPSDWITGGSVLANAVPASVILPTIPRGIMRANVSGTWKSGTPYVNVSGVWKKALAYVNVNGAWKQGL